VAEKGCVVKERVLSSVQIAALLVSASYGIGFLFGSGELALTHGMAGSIYGVATGLGMLALAVVAKPLWQSGLSVWDLFGCVYGSQLRGLVAALSLVWMAGVLAAQVHGGVAVARLLGASDPYGLFIVLGLIYAAAQMSLRIASGVFAACLLLSGVVLMYTLVAVDGLALYLRAVPTFVEDLDTFSPTQLGTMSLAVCLLVVTGADYHQFVMSGRTARSAMVGCYMAGLALILIGFLPAAVVVAMQSGGVVAYMPDGKQVIPWVLSRAVSNLAGGLGAAMLIALSLAALGSGAAILRAMASAVSTTLPGMRRPRLAAASALAIGAMLATRDQGIVETMVSVNIVYLASVGVCFVALLADINLTPQRARATMVAGLIVSGGVYAASWLGQLSTQADASALVAGLAASMGVAVGLGFVAGHRRTRMKRSSR
jgi:solute:Na+ symporter, SSS family